MDLGDYQAFLQALLSSLDAQRQGAKALTLKQARTIAAITLLKQLLYADLPTDIKAITQQWLECTVNLNSICKAFLQRKKSQNSLFRAFGSTFSGSKDTLPDSIDKFFAECRSEASFEQWELIGPTADDIPSNSEANLYILILNLRININLALEEIVVEFDQLANAIQSLIDTQSAEKQINLLQSVGTHRPTSSPQVKRLSTLLIDGAKMQYGLEPNRDDLSTKALDEYKALIIKYLDPSLSPKKVSRDMLYKIEPTSANIKILNLAKRMDQLEQQYGIYLLLFDTINIALKYQDLDEAMMRLELVKTQIESLPADLLPEDIRNLFVQALASANTFIQQSPGQSIS